MNPILKTSGFIFLWMLMGITSLQADDAQNFNEMWKKYQTLENKGSNKDALEQAQKIYDLAVEKNSIDQKYKALIHIYKNRMVIEENSESHIVQDLKTAIQNAHQQEEKSLLQILLAYTYQSYFQAEQYKILDRTYSTELSEDFTLWDARQFKNQISQLYFDAVDSGSALMNVPLKDFSNIIEQQKEKIKGSVVFFDSFYDLILYQAVQYFSAEDFSALYVAEMAVPEENSPNSIPESEDDVNEELFKASKYLVYWKDFLQLDIQADASSSNSLIAQYFFQKWLQIHQNDSKDVLLGQIDDLRLSHSLSDNLGEAAIQEYHEILLKNIHSYPGTESTSMFEARDLVLKYQNLDQFTDWNEVSIHKEALKIIQKYPRTYGAYLAKNIISTIESKSLNIEMESAIYPNDPFKVFVEYTNIPQLKYAIYSGNMDENKIQNKSAEDKWKYFQQKATFRTGDITLKNTQDYKSHSIEIPMKSLPIGKYYIVMYSPDIENNPATSVLAYTQISCTQMATEFIENGDNLIISVVDRKSGTPMQSRVKIYNSDNSRETVISTQFANHLGEIAIPHSQFTNYRRYFVEVTNGKDIFTTAYSKYNYRNKFNDQNQWNSSLKIFTDRAIYRPGQQVFFKGLLTATLNDSVKIIPQKEITIQFKDANYQDIQEQTYTTNEMGSFSGFFKIPEAGLNGNFTIQSPYGSANISVEEYKRPTFEVTAIPIKESVKLGDTISFRGEAKAYNGSNITQANVKYIVHRSSYFPIWCRPYWPIKTENTVITTGITQTDNQGEFTIPFRAIPENEKNQFYNYSISVEVIDISGETRTLESNIFVSNRTVNPELNVEHIWLEGTAHDIQLKAKNFQNQPIEADFQLNIYALSNPDQPKKQRYWQQPDQFSISKSEHDKLFPYDIYKDETEPSTWQQTQSLWSKRVQIYGDSTFKNLPSNLPVGMYRLTAVTMDRKDSVVLEQLIEVRADKNISIIPSFLEVNTDKPVYQSGDDVTIHFSSDLPQVYIKAYVFQKDSLIAKLDQKIQQKSFVWTIPSVKEAITLHYVMIAQNRLFSNTQNIEISKENFNTIQYKWVSFRNKLLPGATESWKLQLTDTTKNIQNIELLATLYDASLDQFVPHNYDFNVQRPRFFWYPNYNLPNSFPLSYFNISQGNKFYNSTSFASLSYPHLNFYNFSLGRNYFSYYMRGNAGGAMLESAVVAQALKAPAEPVDDEILSKSEALKADTNSATERAPLSPEKTSDQGVVFRKNFSETAFFFPQLRSDSEGNFTLDFTMPDAMTKWKFLAFAHNSSVHYGLFEDEIVTQKDLMIQANKPRFVRMGDEIYFYAKISNLSDQDISATAEISLKDPNNQRDITSQILTSASQIPVDIPAKENKSVYWKLQIPSKYEGFIYEVSATSLHHSDGESDIIPVLENRILLTESTPIFIKNSGKTNIDIAQIAHSTPTTQAYALTFEYTSHPIWQALMALPYLNEQNNECASALFQRFYANSMTHYILQSIPESKSLLEAWQKEGSLKSALEKNQELKSVILEATPWLRDAQDETSQMQSLLKLFSDAESNSTLTDLITQLQKLQTPEGGISWFPKMPASRYITQEIVMGFYQLQQLGILHIDSKPEIQNILQTALQYLRNELTEEYNKMKNNSNSQIDNDHLGYIEIQYLYIISHLKDYKFNAAEQYYFGQAKKYALNKNNYAKALISLTLNRWGERKIALELLESLRQSAVQSDKDGMYWKNNTYSYWYEAPIETQAKIIQAFEEVAKDKNTVDELKVWLIRQKQTNRWNQAQATVEACNALLLTGSDWKKVSSKDDIKIDSKTVESSALSAGTGYFKKTWNIQNNETLPKNISIKKHSDAPSWGAVYYQYWEDLDKVEEHSDEIQVQRKLYKVEASQNGEVLIPITENNMLKLGDKVRIKLEIKATRDVEFFHIQDVRASGFEPQNVLSSYKYQGGLAYYEVNGDVATHWYVENLRKGNYVFEYTVFINNSGNYSGGMTFGECLYAPEIRFQTTSGMIHAKTTDKN